MVVSRVAKKNRLRNDYQESFTCMYVAKVVKMENKTSLSTAQIASLLRDSSINQ